MRKLSDNTASFLESLGSLSGTMQNAMKLSNVISEKSFERGRREAVKGAEFQDVKGQSKAYIDGYVSVKARKDFLDFQEKFSKQLGNAQTPEESFKVITEYEDSLEGLRSQGGLFDNTMYAQAFTEGSQEMLSKARVSVQNQVAKATYEDMVNGLGLSIGDRVNSVVLGEELDSTALNTDFSALKELVGATKAAETLSSQVYSSVLMSDRDKLGGSYVDALKAIGEIQVDGKAIKELSVGTRNAWNQYIVSAMNMDNKAAKDAAEKQKQQRGSQAGLYYTALEQGTSVGDVVTNMINNGYTVTEANNMVNLFDNIMSTKKTQKTAIEEDFGNKAIALAYGGRSFTPEDIGEVARVNPDAAKQILSHQAKQAEYTEQQRKHMSDTAKSVTASWDTFKQNSFVFRKLNEASTIAQDAMETKQKLLDNVVSVEQEALTGDQRAALIKDLELRERTARAIIDYYRPAVADLERHHNTAFAMLSDRKTLVAQADGALQEAELPWDVPVANVQRNYDNTLKSVEAQIVTKIYADSTLRDIEKDLSSMGFKEGSETMIRRVLGEGIDKDVTGLISQQLAAKNVNDMIQDSLSAMSAMASLAPGSGRDFQRSEGYLIESERLRALVDAKINSKLDIEARIAKASGGVPRRTK